MTQQIILNNLAVYVTNISLRATDKTVSDFFSFCGKINELVLRPDLNSNGQSQEAVVVFETESASKTALLLTNALIVDKVIQVVQYNESIPFDTSNLTVVSPQLNNNSPPLGESSPQYQAIGDQSPNNNNNNHEQQPQQPPSQTATAIASILASGYSIGQDVGNKARQLDEQHNISNKIKEGADTIKATASEIDNKLHITENATAIKTVVVEKVGTNATAIKNVVVERAKTVDERFQISNMFKSATDMLSQQAVSLASKAQENPTVASGVGFMSNFGATLKSMVEPVQQKVQTQVSQISSESSRIIDEREEEKRARGPTESDALLSNQSQ